jgi:hypothetical protein
MLVFALPLDSKGLRVFCHDDMNYCIVGYPLGQLAMSIIIHLGPINIVDSNIKFQENLGPGLFGAFMYNPLSTPIPTYGIATLQGAFSCS